MTTSLVAPAAQACAFALGCAVIHVARAHAATVSRVLTPVMIATAVLVLMGASLACAPDDDMRLDDITAYNGA
ncbi:hypothetical protein ACLBXJ_26940 [Methylobacterium mesophilicum]